jgi:glycosyltransferase involved in cell wall biosynthesis
MDAAPGSGLTVLFATHDGARTLPRMLDALAAMRPPRRPWRIVAVDNASSDGSGEILAAAAERLPLQVLPCPRPGKMPALIAGARAVEGDLVVLTDDDVEPCPDWLAAYEDAADAHPEAGLFGGPITPTPIEAVGPWFAASQRQSAELFARTDVADGPVDPVARIFGPNLMLRREHLRLLEIAGAALGPSFDRRTRYPMGCDTMLTALAQEQGVVARGVAAARVNHLVRGFQTELDFMLGRAVRHGRGWAIRYVGVRSPSAARRLKLLALGLAGSVSFGRTAAPEAAAFARLWRAHWMRGVALGAAYGPFESRPDSGRASG